MHLTKVAAAILFALTQTSESSLHYAGLDPMISKAVYFLSGKEKHGVCLGPLIFTARTLFHVATLLVSLSNHGELIICGPCQNIYLASGIPLLLRTFFPLELYDDS